MLEHHIQKKILRRLVLGHERFSELNPSGVDSNLYNYHLHQLMAMHYVEKTDGNRYRLTELGKAEGINLGLSSQEMSAAAHPVLLLNVQDTEKHFLLRRRTVHPMFGRTGFLHGEPVATDPLERTAANTLEKRTGVKADFRVSGSGFIRIFIGEHLESFVSFTMLCAVLENRDLPIASSETGENFWTDTAHPDFTSTDMVPSMADLTTLCNNQADNHFFFDKTYHLDR